MPIQVPEAAFWFLKPSSALLYNGGKIIVPAGCINLHHEIVSPLLNDYCVMHCGNQKRRHFVVCLGHPRKPTVFPLALHGHEAHHMLLFGQWIVDRYAETNTQNFGFSGWDHREKASRRLK
jgi:hypothetical protein